MKFYKDTKIGEIMEVAPEKAEILLSIGMHCLGCPASQAETIEEPVRNDFDFEESNKKFDKDNESVDVTAPAYKKDDFFDSLQEHDTKYEE